MKFLQAVKEEDDASLSKSSSTILFGLILILAFNILVRLNLSFEKLKIFIGNSSFSSHPLIGKCYFLFFVFLTNVLRAFVS